MDNQEITEKSESDKREARRAYARWYHAQNPHRYAATRKKWAEKNKELRSLQGKRRYIENKEEIRAKHKAYYEANKEQINSRNVEEHRAKCRAYRVAWKAEDPEGYKEYRRQEAQRNKATRQAYSRRPEVIQKRQELRKAKYVPRQRKRMSDAERIAKRREYTKKLWARIKADPEQLAKRNEAKAMRERRILEMAKSNPEILVELRRKRSEATERWRLKDRIANPEKYAQYNTVNRARKAEDRKQPGYYDKANAWARKRRQVCPEVRLAQALRTTINAALRGRYRTGTLIEMIGCTVEELMRHLEGTWQLGMEWSNYGHGVGKWTVDHRVPLSAHDLSNPEEQKKAFGKDNLQAMWFVDNCSKNSIHEGRKRYHDDHASAWKSPCQPNQTN